MEGVLLLQFLATANIIVRPLFAAAFALLKLVHDLSTSNSNVWSGHHIIGPVARVWRGRGNRRQDSQGKEQRLELHG